MKKQLTCFLLCLILIFSISLLTPAEAEALNLTGLLDARGYIGGSYDILQDSAGISGGLELEPVPIFGVLVDGSYYFTGQGAVRASGTVKILPSPIEAIIPEVKLLGGVGVYSARGYEWDGHIGFSLRQTLMDVGWRGAVYFTPGLRTEGDSSLEASVGLTIGF